MVGVARKLGDYAINLLIEGEEDEEGDESEARP
jgi:hypothetical protein